MLIESRAFSDGGLGRRLPICSQLVEVTLTLSGDLGFPVPRDENLQAIGGVPVVMNTRHLQLNRSVDPAKTFGTVGDLMSRFLRGNFKQRLCEFRRLL